MMDEDMVWLLQEEVKKLKAERDALAATVVDERKKWLHSDGFDYQCRKCHCLYNAQTGSADCPECGHDGSDDAIEKGQENE